MDKHLDVYLRVMGCDPFGNNFPHTSVTIKSSDPPCDYFETGAMIIVSERLKNVLNEFCIHAEFFKIKIIFKNIIYTDQDIYFCHILDCIDCFDYEKSIFTLHDKLGFTDRIKSVSRLVIDEDKTSSCHLFRIAKGAEYIICASDILAAELLANHFSGMNIVRPEEWRFGC